MCWQVTGIKMKRVGSKVWTGMGPGEISDFSYLQGREKPLRGRRVVRMSMNSPKGRVTS